MQDYPFAYTTRQAARLLNTEPSNMRVHYHRVGHYRGIMPTKLPGSGHLLWPRSFVLQVADRHAPTPRTVIDLRTTNPWLETLGLPPDDPAVQRVAIALNDRRHDPEQLPAVRLDEWHALRSWIESARHRLYAARPVLSAEQWTDARRLMALAVAGVVGSLDTAVLDQAVGDARCDVWNVGPA